MAWTVPTLQIAGTIATASWANSDVYGNTLELRATPANRCVAYHNTTQVVGADTTATLNLNSEDLDTATMHDTSTNNNRITIPSGGGGTYLVFASAQVDSGGAGNAELRLRVDGTAIRSVNSRSGAGGSDYEIRTLYCMAIVVMTATQYFDLEGASVGNAMTFGSATRAYATSLEVIGPLPPT
jgi:hypothetical protein